jgi:Fe-S-cluster containining protein
MSTRLRILNMPDADGPSARLDHAPKFLRRRGTVSLHPCNHCDGACCSLLVQVSNVEAWRLALNLAVSIDDVVNVKPYVPKNAFSLSSRPFSLDDGPHTLELKSVGEKPRCTFFMDIGGRGRCGVHGLRPSICRLFPYEFEYKELRLKTGTQSRCPISWLKDDAAERSLQRDVDQALLDAEEETRVIAAWDATEGDRSWGAFCSFVQRELGPYLGVVEDPLQPLVRLKRNRLS